jgi:hypothetical protein
MITLQHAARKPQGGRSVALIVATLLSGALPTFAEEPAELAGDALAPGGVSVGIPLAEAGAALAAAGFARAGDCQYHTREGLAHDGAMVLLATSGDISCTPGEVVRGIYYEYRGDIGVDAPTLACSASSSQRRCAGARRAPTGTISSGRGRGPNSLVPERRGPSRVIDRGTLTVRSAPVDSGMLYTTNG